MMLIHVTYIHIKHMTSTSGVYTHTFTLYTRKYYYKTVLVGEEQHLRRDLLKKRLQKIRLRLGEPPLRSGLILGLQLWRQCRICWVKRFNIIIATCLSECWQNIRSDLKGFSQHSWCLIKSLTTHQQRGSTRNCFFPHCQVLEWLIWTCPLIYEKKCPIPRGCCSCSSWYHGSISRWCV